MTSNKFWTNDKIEKHLINLLFQNCHKTLFLDYHSTTIIKTEKPDYIIGDCKTTIGVEITRALDQNIQKVNNIKKLEYKNIHVCPTLFENENMTREQILKLLKKSKNRIIGKPYVGDELEEKVLKDIIKSIDKKILKYDTYLKFDKNILLVHSETRASLDIELVIKKLSSYIFKTNIKFNFIFLKLGETFYNFNCNSLSTCIIKT